MEKNSFILYYDQGEILEKLSDEDAGKLIKKVFQYAKTREEPELKNVLGIAFIPFKQAIDRNTEKWEEIKKKRSYAGKISAEKKKQESTKSTSINTSQQNVTNLTHDNTIQQNQQKETNATDNVSVNVNVNDNVNVNVNDNNKYITTSSNISKKKEKHKYGKFGRVKLTDDEYFRLIDEFGENFIKKQIDLLDEYVESNNNKNKYSNFNLVIRKSIRENWFKNQQREPDWFNKKNESEVATKEEQIELEKLLGEMTE